jgi:hypothetical protein
MRLYDVHTGKDVWTKNFPANSTVLRSEEPDLAGVVSPDGRATVVSLRTQKEVVVGMVDPKHIQRLQQATLLADGGLVYVAFQVNDPNVNQGVWSNLQPNTGLRAVPVNGAVYAFDRATSKIKWVNEVYSQQLVLEQWKELPIMLFTSRYNKPQGPGGRFGAIQVVGVEAYEKATGKTTFHRPELGQQIGQFYALENDIRNGRIVFTGHNCKVIHTFDDGVAAGGGAGGAGRAGTSSGGSSAPTPTPQFQPQPGLKLKLRGFNAPADQVPQVEKIEIKRDK